MLDYLITFGVLFVFCILCTFFIMYTSSMQEPKSKKVRNLGRKFKVVTGPQFTELYISKAKKQELQELVENTGAEIHEFIANANYFYFVIKHVFGQNPETYIFCSKEPKLNITSEMTHNSGIAYDFVEIPLAFEQLYQFLYSI